MKVPYLFCQCSFRVLTILQRRLKRKTSFLTGSLLCDGVPE